MTIKLLGINLVVASRHREASFREHGRSDPNEERTAAASSSCPKEAASSRRWKRHNKMLIVPFPLIGKEPKDQGRLHRISPRLSKRLTLSFLLLDEKEPKNQGQNHRPSARPPKRLTFKSGSDFCKVKRKRPSLKVKRLVVPWATAHPRFGRASAPTPVEV